jgi:hypothetical protein
MKSRVLFLAIVAALSCRAENAPSYSSDRPVQSVKSDAPAPASAPSVKAAPATEVKKDATSQKLAELELKVAALVKKEEEKEAAKALAGEAIAEEQAAIAQKETEAAASQKAAMAQYLTVGRPVMIPTFKPELDTQAFAIQQRRQLAAPIIALAPGVEVKDAKPAVSAPQVAAKPASTVASSAR